MPWLAVFLLAVGFLVRDSRLALIIIVLIMVVSPVGLLEFLRGGDLLTNPIYVLVLALVFLKVASDANSAQALRALAAVAFGVALASRPVFAVLWLLAVAALRVRAGTSVTIRYSALSAATFLALTLPFYIYAPNRFTPFARVTKLTVHGAISPLAAWMVLVAAILLAVGLAFRLARGAGRSDSYFLGASAIALAAQVLPPTAISAVARGFAGPVEFAEYGLFFLPFAVLAIILKREIDAGRLETNVLDRPADSIPGPASVRSGSWPLL